MRAWLGPVIAVIVLLGASVGAIAQTASALTPGAEGDAAAEVDLTTPEAIREAVATMSDEEVRALLLERLDAVAEKKTGAPVGVLESLQRLALDSSTGFTAAIDLALDNAANLPGGLVEGIERFHAPRGIDGALHLIGVLLLALAAGFALEWVVGRLFRPLRDRIGEAEPETAAQSLAIVTQRLLIHALGVAAFMLGCWGAISTLHPPEPMSYLILWFFLKEPVLYARVAAGISRFLFSPWVPKLRLVHLGCADAKFLHRHIVVAAFLIGFAQYVLDFLGGHGVNLGQLRLGFWLTLAVTLYIAGAIYLARDGLVQIMRGGRAEISPVEAAVARAYPWLAIGVTLGSWMLSQTLVGLNRWDLLDGRSLTTMILLLAAPPLDSAIRWAVRNFGPVMRGEGEIAERAHAATARAYVRIGRVVALAILVVIIADLWDFEITAFASAGLGSVLAARLIEVFAVLATGYIAWEVCGLWMNRKLAEERAVAAETGDDDQGGEGGGAGGSRLSTVLPLVKVVSQTAIAVLTVLVALGALGIDTTPLLAGAGIVGLAIGFGAQKLVADIVSGLFFLIDDAFRIGEYVEVEGTYGTVEKISLRSLRLRHQNGPLHTLPFGEIRKLTNYSRDWVIMKLRFTVPFDTDLKLVKKLFKQIGKEMWADPIFEGDFIQPFKLQGVYEVDDIGIVIRGKFMAVPGRQWVIRKEVYARVQQAFDENGLSFARREVHVRISGDKGDLGEDDMRAVGAAAAEAAGPPAPAPSAPEPGA